MNKVRLTIDPDIDFGVQVTAQAPAPETAPDLETQALAAFLDTPDTGCDADTFDFLKNPVAPDASADIEPLSFPPTPEFGDRPPSPPGEADMPEPLDLPTPPDDDFF